MPRLPVQSYSALIVEPLPATKADALFIKAMLDSPPHLNWEFVSVHSVAAARDILEKRKFDVIVTDLNLMNGAGLNQVAVPIVAAAGETPVVIVTSDLSDGTKSEALLIGVAGYWRKGAEWKCMEFAAEVEALASGANHSHA